MSPTVPVRFKCRRTVRDPVRPHRQEMPGAGQKAPRAVASVPFNWAEIARKSSPPVGGTGIAMARPGAFRPHVRRSRRSSRVVPPRGRLRAGRGRRNRCDRRRVPHDAGGGYGAARDLGRTGAGGGVPDDGLAPERAAGTVDPSALAAAVEALAASGSTDASAVSAVLPSPAPMSQAVAVATARRIPRRARGARPSRTVEGDGTDALDEGEPDAAQTADVPAPATPWLTAALQGLPPPPAPVVVAASLDGVATPVGGISEPVAPSPAPSDRGDPRVAAPQARPRRRPSCRRQVPRINTRRSRRMRLRDATAVRPFNRRRRCRIVPSGSPKRSRPTRCRPASRRRPRRASRALPSGREPGSRRRPGTPRLGRMCRLPPRPTSRVRRRP